MLTEVERLLKPGGRLVTCHFCWLPRQDDIARASEELVLHHNPAWSAADWSGVIPAQPGWSKESMLVEDWFYFDSPIPFTREQWRGRMRACRGVGATLTEQEARRFDSDLDGLLRSRFGEEFTVLHRVDAHILRCDTHDNQP